MRELDGERHSRRLTYAKRALVAAILVLVAANVLLLLTILGVFRGL